MRRCLYGAPAPAATPHFEPAGNRPGGRQGILRRAQRRPLMFVDASAIVAILAREAEADALADVLKGARSPITSPIAIFEADLGICQKRHASVVEAEADVRELLEVAGIRAVPITEREAATALAAFSRYGKGCGHPAQLNLGDCCAYAIAKNHRTALLFKGEDFDKTDIAGRRRLVTGRAAPRAFEMLCESLHDQPAARCGGYCIFASRRGTPARWRDDAKTLPGNMTGGLRPPMITVPGPLTNISPFPLGADGAPRALTNRSCSPSLSRSQLRTGPVSRWMKPECGYHPTPPRRIARAAITASASLAGNRTSSARP